MGLENGDAHTTPRTVAYGVVVFIVLDLVAHGSHLLTAGCKRGRPLPFGPMLLVQVSSSLEGRLTAEGVGWLLLNQRYLERSGLGRTSALAAITLKLLAGGFARVVVTLGVAATDWQNALAN